MHELTEKIWYKKTGGIESLDKLIRDWLTKKVGELYTKSANHTWEIKEILGLTETVKSDWCEHISKSYNNSYWEFKGTEIETKSIWFGDWKYCPLCASPRPDSKDTSMKLCEKEAWCKLLEGHLGKCWNDTMAFDIDCGKSNLTLKDSKDVKEETIEERFKRIRQQHGSTEEKICFSKQEPSEPNVELKVEELAKEFTFEFGTTKDWALKVAKTAIDYLHNKQGKR